MQDSRHWKVFVRVADADPVDITSRFDGDLVATKVAELHARRIFGERLDMLIEDWVARMPTLQFDACEIDVRARRIVVDHFDYSTIRDALQCMELPA